ncbi:hypothetical protein K435DRAFT_930132 [Dendrothele bispora CBS 962.96]|uniref:Uncharacterized protein n=1 Tax=Dendrothele bispora (strain CBS 962.96) TaxID=1314807 RepID=A0A4S8L6F8_DENBC|nr:hypothetical protein K435DRAFT_930132 [Dendrothele bispora CBS 962.96]
MSDWQATMVMSCVDSIEEFDFGLVESFETSSKPKALATAGVVTSASEPGLAISIKHLNKTFDALFWAFLASWSRFSFRRKDDSETTRVTAVHDLFLDMPKVGIFVLLGSNRAGKSTTLEVVGGLSIQTYKGQKPDQNVLRHPS